MEPESSSVSPNVAGASEEEKETPNENMRAAILWALGEFGDFRPRELGEGAYWWRRELRQRAALTSSLATKPQAPVLPAQAEGKQMVERPIWFGPSVPSGPTDNDSKEEEKKETKPDMRSLDAAIHSANEISDKTGLYGRNSGVFGTIVSIIERAVNRQFPPVPSEETGQQQ